MKRFGVPAAFLVASVNLGCGGRQVVAHDFSTPEGAILKLEDAYRNRDIEAAVACKDFLREAQLMLTNMSSPLAQNAEILGKTAEVLELAFRKELQTKGFPDLTGVECAFGKREERPDGIVVVTEVCRYPDGGTSEQRIQTSRGASGWRVLVPVK